jgi:hypothetical protein
MDNKMNLNMTCTKIKVWLTILILGLCNNTFSQIIKGIGGSAIYNFQTKSFGLDLRAEMPLKSIHFLDGLKIVPQITYFPSFNKITEFYIGSSVHLGVYTINKWAFYTLANISYNGWINYKDSNMSDAKFSNLGLEGGIGVTTKACLRPFAEIRYNVKWKEANLRVGLIYTIKCEKRGAVPCSKIPPPPQF